MAGLRENHQLDHNQGDNRSTCASPPPSGCVPLLSQPLVWMVVLLLSWKLESLPGLGSSKRQRRHARTIQAWELSGHASRPARRDELGRIWANHVVEKPDC